ncbi:50S ribosomal protein L11 methyltransferase [Parasegetibacter sp. NRK P23]|uniref:50S ribosomal protein L11 methyltransferase n=1 Tax=Parasegetibacter sp. NRK P23 TaxID=2942999 RepID=UPI002043B906|nr:50S ribosomal protein L11 methyltransferase [Parasegetibacter sp. NRK P23]MCM5526869.1 50S ribosomal protein L11 methyltransferase [Parasegetibacter sp. NRK P23]
MNYIKYTIRTAEETLQQILIAELSELKFEGFEEHPSELIAFIPEADLAAEAVKSLLEEKNTPFTTETIEPTNWNAVWESNFDPVVVGDYCGIRAHFHAPLQHVKHELLITPKMSFGTGHHATTSMMIAHMENLPLNGASVVDYGTGTGILAILAEKEGAARILAIDNDSWSIENAAENLERNACSRTELIQSDNIPASETFSIVLANINKHIILGNLAAIQAAANDYVLLSGLLQEDRTDMLAVFPETRFNLQAEKSKDKWISLLFSVKN